MRLSRDASWASWLSRPSVHWGLAGFGLVGLNLALARLSPNFASDRDLLSQPILILVGIELLAGALFLFVIREIRRTPDSKALLIWALAIGVALRASLLLSTPILEDDYYRYLWDGAVVAEGMNPYAYAPGQIIQAEDGSDSIPSSLVRLAAESGPVISRINYADIRTIYPPVAQAAFALAHWLQPWDLFTWRLVLFGFGLATLALLLLLLRTLQLPLLWSAIYWWNPILIKETFNSAHMDVMALPLVLGAVLLSIRGKHIGAVGSLGLAIGAKVWPIVLLPLILRPILAQPKRLIAALGLLGLLVAVMFFPLVAAGLDRGSGWIAYGQSWEMNDALFMLILWGGQGLLKVAGLPLLHGQLLARVVVAVMLFLWIGWLSRKSIRGPVDFCRRCLLIVAGVFLLSPTQFPWYYIWLLPFLAVRPRWSLLVLTALLPLYYLRFYFDAHDHVGVFDFGLVWLEYVPVWYLLIREWASRRRSTAWAEGVA